MEFDPTDLKGLTGRQGKPQFKFFDGAPVGPSDDLKRVLAIPRRSIDVTDPRAAVAWTNHLRRERATPCDCVKRWGFCIDSLNPAQGWALENAMDAMGLLGSIGVGEGKTGIGILLAMAIPGVRTALLLIPSQGRNQLLARDIPQWSQHFKIPNVAGSGDYVVGRPTLHVMTYSEFSLPKNTDVMRRLNVDLTIGDEGHNLKNPVAARGNRFLKAYGARPQMRGAIYSGTLSTQKIEEVSHLSAIVLRESSPFPVHPPVVEEWGRALNAPSKAQPFNCEPGKLLEFCGPAEADIEDLTDRARAGFQRRLRETLGYVATAESAASIKTSLLISERKTECPDDLLEVIKRVRDSKERPDGEQFVTSMEVWTCLDQLSSGFYYRWRFPRMEPEKLIETWRERRKKWHKELRAEINLGREHLDSKALCTYAAIRWHDGYTHNGVAYPPGCKDGPSPVFESQHFPAYREVHKAVRPVTEPVWISDWLARDAAAWAMKAPGIVWYEHTAFGEKIESILKEAGANVPRYGGGAFASAEILKEKGDRSILASIPSHSEIKNLQRAFWRNLFANVPGNGKTWEQAMGRTHRQGQPSDEVSVELYQHTPVVCDAFRKAREEARYAQNTMGNRQKLCYATFDLD